MIAYLSSAIFCVFPFQVWLSSSGLPESIFFFFVIACCYYLINWYGKIKNGASDREKVMSLMLASVSLNFANLLRYEGWIFTITTFVLVLIICIRRFRFRKELLIYVGISLGSFLTIVWWLIQNKIDHGDLFFFAHETTKIFEGLSTAGFLQRVVQYPSFIFYIAPITTILGIWKIILTIKDKRHDEFKDFKLVKIFLAFNISQLLLLMFSGMMGSGGTNMVSRYIVVNSMLMIPYAVWQIIDLKKYLALGLITAVLILNISWSFTYPQAYREDTFEVAELTRKLQNKGYFEQGDKIYFEATEGYFDTYPLQVISNNPKRFITDTIPSYFPITFSGKKISKRKIAEEQQRLNILELRKFLETKKVKLCVVRSDLLVDKLSKFSYKKEQIGDYNIFYLSENKLQFKRENQTSLTESNKENFSFAPDMISFDKKLILKEYRFDNSNLGLNPQTATLIWNVVDASLFDSLAALDNEFGRYRIKLDLVISDTDSSVYDTHTSVFSERNVEEFFEAGEIKNILILKPFAMLNYSVPGQKRRPAPFEGGVYDMRLSLIDMKYKKEMKIYKGDSLYSYSPEIDTTSRDSTIKISYKTKEKEAEKQKEKFLEKPYLNMGKIIAFFPESDYNKLVLKSKDLPQIIARNGLLLLFSQRYKGDHFLNWVFNYF